MSLSANLERHAVATECYDDDGQRRHVFHGERMCRCGLWEAEDHRQNATAHWNNGVAIRDILASELVRGLAVSTPPTTGERYLSGLASDQEAGRQHMAWCRTVERVANCRAGLLIMPFGAVEPYDTVCVWSPTPKLLFAQLAAEFFPPLPDAPPIVGQNVRIHPTAHVVNAVIGNNVTIGAHCAIGGPGFGFVEHDGQQIRFPQRGRVLIGDDVEIGNNTCIDRGALGDTIIHRGAKIDNLVHVAHGCFIGEGALVVAGAVLCGGVTVGDHAWIGAGAMVREQLLIGSRAVVGMGAVVVKHVPNGATVMGNPARPR